MVADSDSKTLGEAGQTEAVLATARSVVSTCLDIRKDEEVVVITDPSTSDIGRALYEAAAKITDRILLVMIPPSLKPGKEPPLPVGDLMRSANVIIIATQNSLTHTRARANASSAGARIASMPGIDTDSMVFGGMTQDYATLNREIRGMNSVFRRRRDVHVTTPAGSDLKFTTGGRWILDDTGLIVRPGAVGNLPAGKIFVLPSESEGAASGTIVIDGSWEGRLLDEPLRFDVAGGLVTEITGGERADEIKSILDMAKSGLRRNRERVYTVAEFGFGMNSRAQQIVGNRLEDQVVRGSAYFSFGDNIALGGSAKIGVKMSGVMRKPTVMLDEIALLTDGKVTVS